MARGVTEEAQPTEIGGINAMAFAICVERYHCIDVGFVVGSMSSLI